MKARILDTQVTVYRDADFQSPPIVQLVAGNEVELGQVAKKSGKQWVGVTLPNGQRGYLPGEAKIFSIRKAKLLQKEVTVYDQPSPMAIVKGQQRKGAAFHMTEVVKRDDRDWVRIRDQAGNEGYIEGKTRIRVIVEASKELGKRNMLYGALWCIGGILVTGITFSAARSGGTYFIAWGAVLFGGFQFLQGLYQYLTGK